MNIIHGIILLIAFACLASDLRWEALVLVYPIITTFFGGNLLHMARRRGYREGWENRGELQS